MLPPETAPAGVKPGGFPKPRPPLPGSRPHNRRTPPPPWSAKRPSWSARREDPRV